MMSGKEIPLSIVIRTVDKATAGINAINKRLDAAQKPYKDLGKAFTQLQEKSGFNAVVDGFKGIGSAVTDVIGKVAVIGGVVTAAVAGVFSLVDHFDQLGDTAERLGTSADFLAAFRYAAERAGAPLEGVDTALQTLVVNLGAAKAGTGKLLVFMNKISPVFAKQVTSAGTLEDAIGLLAAASAKLPDAFRRDKLAAAAFGDPALAPLLQRGPKGVQELLTEFAGLAGNLSEATDAAGKTDDALKKMHAATEGVKAALVKGLAPALTIIVDKLTTWFVAHRADVERWAKQIGDELPSIVERLAVKIEGAIKTVGKFVDGIGGWKAAALGIAAIISGPLVASIVSLGLAMTATPFGLFLTGIAAVLAGIALLTADLAIAGGPRSSKSYDAEEKLLASGAIPGNTAAPTPTESKLMASGALPKSRRYAIAEGRKNALSREATANVAKTRADDAAKLATTAALPSYGMQDWRLAQPFQAAPQQTNVNVTFSNAPKGMRATVDPGGTAAVDLTVGHNLFGVP